MPIDYQNGKIYKLWSPSENLFYIGSTTQKLSQRKTKHVSDFKKWQNGKFPFMTSFTILECDDHRIDLIETFPCNNREELISREGFYIRKENCVNKITPGRTQKEYYVDNKKEILERNKDYRNEHKEEISKQKKQYRELNKVEILQKKKEYYNDNKIELVKKQKQYYEANKNEILEKEKIKITCECNSIVRKSDIARHKKSKKHLAFIESQKEKEYATIIFA